MTAEAPTRPMQVVGKKLLVRLTRPPERTPGGLWLPDGLRRNLSQGVVIAACRWLDRWTKVWCDEGETVLFPEHKTVPVTRETVIVYPTDLLGVIFVSEEDGGPLLLPSGEWMSHEEGGPVLLPANDWLLVDRDSTPDRSRGGILLPESARRGSRSGVVRDMGPGKLVDDERLETANLVGSLIHWSPRAEVVTVTSAGEACTLVRAGDVDAVEVVE